VERQYWYSPSAARSRAKLWAVRNVYGWSSPWSRRRRLKVSSSRLRACWWSPSERRSAARSWAESMVSGVVGAQRPAASAQSVLVQDAGWLMLAEDAQDIAEVAG
jgi:hypothetical protein